MRLTDRIARLEAANRPGAFVAGVPSGPVESLTEEELFAVMDYHEPGSADRFRAELDAATTLADFAAIRVRWTGSDHEGRSAPGA